MRFKDKLVVGFVWGLIAFQGFSFLYLFASNLYVQNNFLFVLYIPLFLVVVSILCASYYRATLSNPGTPNYLTNINYGQQIDQIKISARKESQQKKQRRLKKKKGQIDLRQIQLLNTISYCFKCDVVKEKRVHHCSVCKKCIIRMDHHCPWTGNCVGRYNHKYFILFLFYATTGLLMVSIAITIDYLTGSFYSSLLQSQGMRFWLLINCITSYMLATSIGFLFITQMITGCQNITTLESFTSGIKQRNPWNHQSSIQNLRQIFGYSNWLLPTDPFPDIPKNQSSSFQLVSL